MAGGPPPARENKIDWETYASLIVHYSPQLRRVVAQYARKQIPPLKPGAVESAMSMIGVHGPTWRVGAPHAEIALAVLRALGIAPQPDANMHPGDLAPETWECTRVWCALLGLADRTHDSPMLNALFAGNEPSEEEYRSLCDRARRGVCPDLAIRPFGELLASTRARFA